MHVKGGQGQAERGAGGPCRIGGKEREERRGREGRGGESLQQEEIESYTASNT